MGGVAFLIVMAACLIAMWLRRKSRRKMKTGDCGRVHMGPVVVWQGDKARCEHCNNILSIPEIQSFNKTRSAALDVQAKALLAASKTR